MYNTRTFKIEAIILPESVTVTFDGQITWGQHEIHTINTIVMRRANLPVVSGKLRLYCLRLSDSVLIAGGGGRKSTKTYNEDSNLNGYVISLQKLDELIKVEVKREILQ